MIIDRNEYIAQLFAKQWNGKVKIVTGLRRSGKSFLLFTLFKNRLIEEGAQKEDFVEVALDRKSDIKYRNPNLLYDYIMEQTKDMDRKYYVLIDEIQLSYKIKNEYIDESLVPEEDRDKLYITFYDILNDLMARPNLDVYVTGSNSKMLSHDIVTNFRDRGSEIKIYPLSFAEYLSVSRMEKADALEEYLVLCYLLIDGYSLFSLILASLFVNCQLMVEFLLFRCSCQSATSFFISSKVEICLFKHCLFKTCNSISAILSQLPCFGVNTKSNLSHILLASSGSNASYSAPGVWVLKLSITNVILSACGNISSDIFLIKCAQSPFFFVVVTSTILFPFRGSFAMNILTTPCLIYS